MKNLAADEYRKNAWQGLIYQEKAGFLTVRTRGS
jgi:hypothetical protein